MKFVLLIAAAASQTLTPTCQTLIQDELKKVDCGLTSISTNTSDVKSLINQVKNDLSKICSDTCDAGLKNVITAIKNNAECSSQQIGQGATLGNALDSYSAIRRAICIKTSDNQSYCLEKQLVILEPILASADPQNPTTALTAALANKDLVCTDCVAKQLEQLKDIEQLKTLNVQQVLDQTCAGKITTVGSTTTTNSAVKVGSVIFAAAAIALSL